jgi:hypothetical protein
MAAVFAAALLSEGRSWGVLGFPGGVKKPHLFSQEKRESKESDFEGSKWISSLNKLLAGQDSEMQTPVPIERCRWRRGLNPMQEVHGAPAFRIQLCWFNIACTLVTTAEEKAMVSSHRQLWNPMTKRRTGESLCTSQIAETCVLYCILSTHYLISVCKRRPRLDAEKISNRWIVPLSSYLANIVQSWTN